MSQQRILKSRSLQTINPQPPHNNNFYSGTASSSSCNNIESYYNGSDTTTNSNCSSNNSSNRNSIDSNFINNNNSYNNSNNNNNNSFDQNFDILKGEYNNLSNMIYNIHNSLMNYCNSIKDIYLNSDSFMNNVQKYFGPEHPLSKYGFGVIGMANQGFGEWMDNQQSNFQLLGEYVQELDTVRSKIDRVDQLSLQLNDTNIGEYMALKDELFKEVSDQIDNRINKFDIPLIQTQLSFSSLYQCLNVIHETNGTENLQQPIQKVENPIRESNLLPDNTFYYQQQQQKQQQLEQAQAYEQIYQPPPQQQLPPQRVNTATTYSNSSMLLSKPVKTEIPHTSANGPKKLERVGVREYSRAPPQPTQSSPLKPLARPPSANYSNSSPLYQPPPQPSAPPQQDPQYIDQQQPLQQPVEQSSFKQQSNIFRQVLPVSNNQLPPVSNNNSINNESGVIEQPLRPVPHKSVQARPPLGGPLNNSSNNNKPPFSPQPQSQPPQQIQSKPPPLRPVSVNLSQQSPSPRSTTQPNPLNQLQRPAPSPFVQNNNNSNINNVQQPNQSFSRPLPNSIQQSNNFSNQPPAVNRHQRTNSVDRYSQQH